MVAVAQRVCIRQLRDPDPPFSEEVVAALRLESGWMSAAINARQKQGLMFSR
jgi:hypothetical protein